MISTERALGAARWSLRMKNDLPSPTKDLPREKGGRFEDLKRSVVDQDLCSRCGACVAACPVRVLEFSPSGPKLSGECIGCGTCIHICHGPGIDMSSFEKGLFGRSRKGGRGRPLGLYQKKMYLSASDRSVFRRGYFGGRVSAVLISALKRGDIDCALLTDWGDKGDISMGKARIVRTEEGILSHASTKYVFSPVLTLLPYLEMDPDLNRAALVGLPCHIQAFRKMRSDPVASKVTSKVKYLISLNCGSSLMEEGDWRDLLGRLMEVPSDGIGSVNARKTSGSTLRFVVGLKDGHEVERTVHIGRYFKEITSRPRPSRCDMCPDYSGELSDLTFGAPVIRTRQGMELIDGAMKDGSLRKASIKMQLSQRSMDIVVSRKKRCKCLRTISRRRRRKEPCPVYG